VWWWGRPWYWNHWRWHNGFWNWVTLPTIWVGASALASPGDTYVFNNPFFVLPQSSSSVVPEALNYSNSIPAPSGDEAADAFPPEPESGDESDEALPTNDPPPAPTDNQAVNEANERFDEARKAFYNGDYAKAQRLVDQAIQVLPSDATLHEFRALTLFAQKKYKEAAATLYAVLWAGPGWNKDTMATLYPHWDTYTRQVRALEAYVKDHPDQGYAHFLLAYHYLVVGSMDQAIAQLKEVIRLDPKDQLSTSLVNALTQPQDSAKGGSVKE
jgi:tetratricopeptide (TPR) repeat protein